MYEAMQRLQVEAFLESLDEVERVNTVDFILCMSESFPDDPFHEYVKCPVFQELCDTFNRFVMASSSKSRLFAFWSMYIRMIGMCEISTNCGLLIIPIMCDL